MSDANDNQKLDELNADIQALRGQLVDLQGKLGKLSGSDTLGSGDAELLASLRQDLTAVGKKLTKIKEDARGLEGSLSMTAKHDLAKKIDHCTTSYQQLRKNITAIRTGPAVEVGMDQVPDYVAPEFLQELAEKKQEKIETLAITVKQMTQIQGRITEKLDEGAEIMDDVENGITRAHGNIDRSVSRMKLFQTYLKRNKAPIASCLLSFIIMIIFWSSKAFCDWGLTWQCP